MEGADTTNSFSGCPANALEASKRSLHALCGVHAILEGDRELDSHGSRNRWSMQRPSSDTVRTQSPGVQLPCRMASVSSLHTLGGGNRVNRSVQTYVRVSSAIASKNKHSKAYRDKRMPTHGLVVSSFCQPSLLFVAPPDPKLQLNFAGAHPSTGVPHPASLVVDNNTQAQGLKDECRAVLSHGQQVLVATLPLLTDPFICCGNAREEALVSSALLSLSNNAGPTAIVGRDEREIKDSQQARRPSR